jgi:hypothetical protein
MSIDEATQQKIMYAVGSLVVQTITLSPQWATEEIFPQTVECARPLSPSL